MGEWCTVVRRAVYVRLSGVGWLTVVLEHHMVDVADDPTEHPRPVWRIVHYHHVTEYVVRLDVIVQYM